MSGTYSRRIAETKRLGRALQRATSALVRAAAGVLKSATGAGVRVNTSHEIKVMNAALYVSLHQQDMAVFTDEYLSTRSQARKRVYARVLALHYVVFFDDFPTLIKDAVHSDAAFLAETEGRELLRVAADLRPIRRRYERILRSIGNSALAHRDLDALRQLDSITTIDLRQFSRFLTDMMFWQAELAEALLPVFVRMAREMSARVERIRRKFEG